MSEHKFDFSDNMDDELDSIIAEIVSSGDEAEAVVTDTANEAATEDEKTKKEDKSDALDWVQCIATALIACILIFVFIGRTVGVIGPSMQSTLMEGDRLVISHLFYTPKEGDIVVLRKDTYGTEPIIKRIIALEGDIVDIDFDEGIVYVNGEALKEPYANTPTNRQLDFEGPITVPEGCAFVLGDNRNSSNDSRDGRIGCVDTRYIIGKAIFRIAPLSKFGTIK